MEKPRCLSGSQVERAEREAPAAEGAEQESVTWPPLSSGPWTVTTWLSLSLLICKMCVGVLYS